MDVVIGLDTGTTSTKAVAAGADGQVRAHARAGYRLQVPEPGRAELDPADLFAAARTVLREVVGGLPDGDRVVAVCLSAAMHGVVPLDARGEASGPLVTWADDRAAGVMPELAGVAAGLHARTGTPVHPMSPLAKLAWWRTHDPDLLRRTHRWGGVKDLVVTALCGPGRPIDLSCAATTGMYDIHARRWDDEALAVTGVRREQLPDVVPTTHRLELLADVGLPGVPLVVGAADGPLANLGLGAVGPGVAAVSLGTSGALRVMTDRPAVDEQRRLFCYPLTEDHWVLGGAVNNAASVLHWARDSFEADEAELMEEAAAEPPGSEGLLCLPYLLGERAPWWRAGLRGAYLGLRRDHHRGHLVRAAIEGVCQQLALVRDAVVAAGVPVAQVRATGGAVAAELWVSTLAAALDQEVRTAESPEGTAVGACLLGLHALGVLPDLEAAADVVDLQEPVRPDPAAAARYARMRPLIEQATLAVADILAELDDISDTTAPGAERTAAKGDPSA